jgi:hypothetical protein
MLNSDFKTANVKNSFYFKIKENSKPLSKVSNLASSAIEKDVSNTKKKKSLKLANSPLYTEEEIKAYSLLEHPLLNNFPIANPNPDTQSYQVAKLGLNFLGGGVYGDKNNSLEGVCPEENFKVWCWLFDLLKNDYDFSPQEKSLIDELSTDLAQLQNITAEYLCLIEASPNEAALKQLAEKHVKLIKKLPEGKSHRLFGGWLNFGGGDAHALIYEFERSGAKEFNVYIYTSTGYQLGETYLCGIRSRLKPYILYKNVPESTLFFNSDGKDRVNFIQSLIETNVLAQWDANWTVGQEDVLEIFDYIDPYRVNVPLIDCGVISGQRAETCVPSSTKVWIRKRCGNLALYRQIMFHCTLRLTIAVYQSCKDHLSNNTPNAQHYRELLKLLAERLYRRSAKLSVDSNTLPSLIDFELTKQANATAQQLLEEVARAEKKSKKHEKKEIFLLNFSTADFERQRKFRQKKNHFFISESKSTFAPEIWKLDPLPIVSDAKSALQILENILSRTGGSTDFQATKAINNLHILSLIDLFPIPQITLDDQSTFQLDQASKDFWEKLTPLEMQKCQILLEKLLKAYQQNDVNNPLQRKLAVIFPVFAIAHFLAIQIDKSKGHQNDGSLDNYSILFRFENLHLEEIMYLNRKEFDRIQSAIRYFKTHNSRKKKILFISEDTTIVEKNTIEEAPDNAIYWISLLNQNKLLDQLVIKKAEETWPDLTEKQINDDYTRNLEGYRNGLRIHEMHQDKSPYYEQPPQKKTNLPLNTKKLLILEEGVSHSNVLIDADLEYIPVLRRLVYFTHQFLSEGKWKQYQYDLSCHANRPSLFLMKGTVKKPGSSKDSFFGQNNFLLKLKFDLASEHQEFIKTPDASRKSVESNKSKAEGAALQSEFYDPLLYRIFRTLSQWELAPQQLIHELSKDFSSLADASLQNLFKTLFFRSPIIEGSEEKLGVGQLITENEALYDNAKEFIFKGLNYAHQHKHIQIAKFFFEISFYLARYLIDGGCANKAKALILLSEVTKWLNHPKLKSKDREQLYAFPILFYSLLPLDQLSIQDLSAVYSCWISHQLNPSPLFSNTIQKYILELTLYQNNKLSIDDLNIVGNGILKEVLNKKHFSNRWELQTPHGFPCIELQDVDGHWMIDLAAGYLIKNGNKLEEFDNSFPWVEEEFFLRLFTKTEEIQYRSLNSSTTLLTHPVLGEFHLIKSSHQKYFIKHFFSEVNAWLQYQNSNSLSLDFPGHFVDDHLFWSSENFFINNQIKLKGYFTKLASTEIAYALTQDGMIIEVNHQGEPKANDLFFDCLDSNSMEKISGFLNFDHRTNILCLRNSKGAPQKLLFTRYTSLEGNPLEFIYEEGRLIWKDNRQYYISQQVSAGLCGQMINYLYLEPLDPKKPAKILIPFQEVKLQNSSKLLINNIKPLMQSDKINGQQGIFKYFTFNLVNGKLQFLNLEGRLFLAYLYYSQNKYQEAIDLLKGLTCNDIHSPTACKIIDILLKWNNKDQNPNSKMVYLHVMDLIVSKIDNQTEPSQEDYFADKGTLIGKSIVALGKYLQVFSNVSVNCRFTHEKELSLLSELLKQGKQKIGLILNNVQFRQEPIQLYFSQIEARIQHLNHCSSKISEPQLIFKGKRAPCSSNDRNQNFSFTSKHYKFISNPEAYKPRDEDEYEFRRKQRDYKIEIENATSWLTQGDTSCIFRRPLISLPKRNGKLFIKVYKIAKTGSSDEKRAMLFQLFLWYTHKVDLDHLEEMIVILLYPACFEDLIDIKTSSTQEKYNFLHRFDISYNTVIKQKKISKEEILGHFSNNASCEKPSTDIQSYPISMISPLDLSPAPLNTIHPIPVYLAISMQNEKKRWATLSDWKSKYVEKTKNKENILAYKDFSLKFDSNFLSENEKKYSKSTEKDFNDLQKEYAAGKELNEITPSVNFNSNNCLQLNMKAEKVFNAISEDRENLELELLSKINVRSKNPLEREFELATLGGKCSRLLNFDDCLEMVLSFDERIFQQKNKHINSSAQAIAITELTLKIEDLKSYQAQLKRIIDLTNEIRSIDNEEDSTRCYLCQKLFTELEAKYYFENFSSEEQTILRVFAGETEILPFKIQMSLIRDMLILEEKDYGGYKDKVIQLIMGGGKTSVIATLVLYLSARRKGRLALFIVPASLLATVKVNLNKAMYQAFRKNIFPFHLNREDLVADKLIETLNQIKQAKKKQQPLVTSAATLQCIELEFLSEARRLKNIQFELQSLAQQEQDLSKRSQDSYRIPISQKEIEDIKISLNSVRTEISSFARDLEPLAIKIGYLAEIMDEFENFGDALIDEVDLILDILQEVNFPEGKKIKVKAERNRLLYTIYRLMTSREIKIKSLPDQPCLDDFIQLRKNNQTEMNKQLYLEHVVPIIANHIGCHFEDISDFLNENQIDSFVRYVTEKIPPYLQELCDEDKDLSPEFYKSASVLHQSSFEELQDDLAFLKFLKDLYCQPGQENKDKKRIEAANLIVLTKRFLMYLLSYTLQKSGKRNYGPLKSGPNAGKMIPYLSVAVPAITEFGYHWEAAAFTYQYGLAFKPTKKQILNIANVYREAAHYYTQKNGELFEKTAEYEEFFQLYGVKLDEIDQPKKLEEAIANISNDTQKCLDVQYQLIAKFVDYYEEYLTANGMTLCQQTSSQRAMSGTPWNVEGYDRHLAQNFHPDRGTEGRILHALAKRATQESLHEVDFQTIDGFLESIYKNHPRKKCIRGIIETGGLFKIFKSNLEVAKGIMSFLERHQKDDWVDSRMEAVLFFHRDPGQDQPNTLYAWRKGSQVAERIGDTSVETLCGKGLTPACYFVYYDELHTTGTDILQTPDAINLVTVDVKMLRRTLSQGVMRLRQLFFGQGSEFVVSKEGRQSLVRKGETLEDIIINGAKVQSIRKAPEMVRFFKSQIDNIFRYRGVKSIRQGIKEKVNCETLAVIIQKAEPYFVSFTKDEPFLQYGRIEQEFETKSELKNYLTKKSVGYNELQPSKNELENTANEAKEMAQWIDKAQCLPDYCSEFSSISGLQQEISLQTQAQVNLNVFTEQEINLELQSYLRHKAKKIRSESPMCEIGFLSLLNQMKSIAQGNHPFISLQHQLSKYKYGLFNKNYPYQNVFSESIYGTKAYFYTYDDEEIIPVFSISQRPPEQILVTRCDNKYHWLLLSEHEARDVQEYLLKYYEKNSSDVKDVWLIEPNSSLYVKHANAQEFPLEDDDVQNGLLEINVFGGEIPYLSTHDELFKTWLNTEKTLKTRFLKLKVAKNEKYNVILRTVVLSNDDKPSKSKVYLQCKRRLEQEKLKQGKYLPSNSTEAASLPPIKVKELHVDFVKYLTADQLNHIEKFQGGFVTHKQIPALPAAKVKYLQKPEQIYEEVINEDGSKEIHYLLSLEQALCLERHQRTLVSYLNPDFYSEFKEKWQIQSIPIEHLNKIPPSNWRYLRKEQLKLLENKSAKQIKQFILHGQYGSLHGNDIPLIDPSFYSRIKMEQIQEITDIAMINQLEELAKKGSVKEGLWTSWITPSMVRFINVDTQLKHLKSAYLISEIKQEWVCRLDAKEQVPLIKTSQVKELKGSEQIKACPPQFMKELEADQINDVSNENLAYLTENVKYIKDVNKFAALSSEKNEEKGLENQMKWILDEQLSLVTTVQVKGLSIEQLLKFSQLKGEGWSQWRHHIAAVQVKNFDRVELLELLEKDQFEHIEERQVPLLNSEKLIQYCPGHLVSKLNPIAQIPFISHEQLNLVTEEQVAGLSNEQLLKLSQLKGEGWSQWRHHIAAVQIKNFDRVELLELLAEDQLQGIEEKQVSFLTSEKLVQNCPERLLNKLNDEQFKRISIKQIQQLKKEQLIRLKKEQACHLLPTQIRQIDTQKEVALLEISQWIHLSALGIQALTNQQLVLLQNTPDLYSKIKLIPPKRLYLINSTEASTHVIEDQLDRMESNVNNLQPESPLWPKINIKERVAHLAVDKFRYLNDDALKHVEGKERIQTIPFGKVRFLTREQLKERSWKQFLIYAIGVTLLAVIFAPIVFIAYLSLAGFSGAQKCLTNKKDFSFQVSLQNDMTSPAKALYRLFEIYLDP